MIIQAGIQLLVAVISGLVQALPRLVGYVPTIIAALFRALVAGVGQMLSAGAQLLSNVVTGIRNGISSVVSIGRNIVEGIWKGISNGLGWIKSKITGWVGDVMSFLKKLFGIGSPSKLMRDEVGIYMAEGIGVGFENGMADVERTMRNSMPDFGELVGETTVPVSYVVDAYGLNGIGAARGSGATINYGGVNIIIEGRGKDANELARELQIILNRKAASFA
jgi:phage-related protein